MIDRGSPACAGIDPIELRPGVFHTDLAACNGFNADEPVSEIACPALVIAGDEDRMTPAKAGLDIASHLPNARIVRLTNCGHAMLSERPNEVLDALIGIVGGGSN